MLAAPGEVGEDYMAAAEKMGLGTLARLEEERKHAALIEGGV